MRAEGMPPELSTDSNNAERRLRGSSQPAALVVKAHSGWKARMAPLACDGPPQGLPLGEPLASSPLPTPLAGRLVYRLHYLIHCQQPVGWRQLLNRMRHCDQRQAVWYSSAPSNG